MFSTLDPFKKHALVLAMSTVLVACGSDDNDGEIRELQEQNSRLEEQILDLSESSSSVENVTALQAEIADLREKLAELEKGDKGDDPSVEELTHQLEEMQKELEALTSTAPVLGSNATKGTNLLPEDAPEDQILRFAVFPDTQGRDDDGGKTVNKGTFGGVIIEHDHYAGYDFNGDGFYDGGHKTRDHNDPSYLVDVSDPQNPKFVLTADGAFKEDGQYDVVADGKPVLVKPEQRKDYGYDWKVIPVPLVEAIVHKMQELDVDLVLSIGDMTEYRAESDYVQWQDSVAKPLAESGIDIFPLRGNHEIVSARNWNSWFSNTEEWARQSVDNVFNGISVYEGQEEDGSFDQGYALYKEYVTKPYVQPHLDSGKVVGFPGAEDLVYYFKENNNLFIGIDYYFGDLVSTDFNGTWLVIADWLKETIHANAQDVDHIFVFGHEPLSTKKRMQVYEDGRYNKYLAEKERLLAAVSVAQAALNQAQVDETAAQAAFDTAEAGDNAQEQQALQIAKASVQAAEKALEAQENELDSFAEPGLKGHDLGQLGLMKEQEGSRPGLTKEILDLFTDYNVTYLSGHDHQYARSLIHTDADAKKAGKGFTQIIVGNGSWKGYENGYGEQPEHETSLYIDNYKEVDNKYSNGISFTVVEVNGRQVTTKNYYADETGRVTDDTNTSHSEDHMASRGLFYDRDNICWDYNYKSDADTVQCEAGNVKWEIIDENTRTSDALTKVVAPEGNYFASTQAPAEEGYVGTKATIMEGYNVTYNTSHAKRIDKVVRMSELFSMSWFADNNDKTVSDVLWISGNQTQEGSHFDPYGAVETDLSKVDSYLYQNHRSEDKSNSNEVENPTYVTRDGKFIKGTDILSVLETPLNSHETKEGDRNWANWDMDSRYDRSGGQDFADAMAIAFTAPEGTDLSELTIGRYDEASGEWVQAVTDSCYVPTGYSQHMSVWYRISEQGPEEFQNGDKALWGCQQLFWGQLPAPHAIWGFVHTDGRYALIKK